MKRTVAVISLIFCLLPLCRAAGDDVLTAIVEAGRQTASLECEFVQTRHPKLLNSAIVSKGRMSYRNPDVLVWEYTEPVALSLTMDGGKVSVVRDGVTEKSGSGVDRMFSQIARMVVGGITGKSLSDRKAFETVIEEKEGGYVAYMKPLSGGARGMLSSLVLHFDRKSLDAVRIEIYESSGDKTVIEFKNIKRENFK